MKRVSTPTTPCAISPTGRGSLGPVFSPGRAGRHPTPVHDEKRGFIFSPPLSSPPPSFFFFFFLLHSWAASQWSGQLAVPLLWFRGSAGVSRPVPTLRGPGTDGSVLSGGPSDCSRFPPPRTDRWGSRLTRVGDKVGPALVVSRSFLISQAMSGSVGGGGR